MGHLKVFDDPRQYPKWDYIHPSYIQTHPIIMYYVPNESVVYTVKLYWKSKDYQDGIGLIMDSSELPHQGACVQTFTIQ